jgi:outer membrane protein assembly factor BamB
MFKKCTVGINLLSVMLLAWSMNALAGAGSESWRFNISNTGVSGISPAQAPDGTIYIGHNKSRRSESPVEEVCESCFLFAINKEGSLKWKIELTVTSTASIGPDGTIYVGCDSGRLCAVNNDGSLKWTFQTGSTIVSFPTIGPDGTIYVGSTDNHLYALDSKEGILKWAYDTAGPVRLSAAIGREGTIYLPVVTGQSKSRIDAIAPDRRLLWSYGVPGKASISTPAIGLDGTVYFGGGRNFYALDARGNLKWKYTAQSGIFNTPVIGVNETIVVTSTIPASENGVDKLYSFSSIGSVEWVLDIPRANPFGIPAVNASAPAIGDDGVIYFGSFDSDLWAVNSDGTPNWKFRAGEALLTAPVLGNDGKVYVNSFSATMFAIETTSTQAAQTAWPMLGQNSGHSGASNLEGVIGFDQLNFAVFPETAAVLTGVSSMLTISGGLKPYRVVVKNGTENLINASVFEGNKINISGLSKGKAELTILDASNDSLDIDVTVLSDSKPDGYVIAAPQGYEVSSLKIGAMIDTVEKGFIEALWFKGGEEVTTRGDTVIWGYFYADPSQVSWGSQQNPEVFVKIWFDVSGRIDVNYFHVSVPNIKVFSNVTGDPDYDEQDWLSMNFRRYVRHFAENAEPFSEAQFENGFCFLPIVCDLLASKNIEPQMKNASLDGQTMIAAVIHTVEAGDIEAVWQPKGQDVTQRGDKVVWGYFSADPEDVSWGSDQNPEVFVKIWRDVSGHIDVNYFHVSVPDISVVSSDNENIKSHTSFLGNRYIRDELRH